MQRFNWTGLLVCVFATYIVAQTKAEPGLLATYSDSSHSVITMSSTPNFALRENESIHPQIAREFAAVWDGVLKIDRRAKYTFTVDGAADAKLIIHGNDANGGTIELDPGDHPIKLEYTRKPGAARVQLLWAADFFAAEPVPPSVLSHRSKPGQGEVQSKIEGGQLLVEQLNCIACHSTQSTRLIGLPGPDLAHVGTRLRPAWIARLLMDSAAFRLDTRMPYIAMSPDEQRDAAAYLASLKNPANKIKEPQPSTSHVAAGKQLVETIGCTACHGGTKGHALEGLGSKWFPGQLADYLQNPRGVDHSGLMPSLLLTTKGPR